MAMTLGIVSVVLVFMGCCCGLFSIVSLALSIIGLVMANRSLKLFANSPDSFTIQSYTNVKNAKILNIVALVISSLVTLVYVLYFVIYGAFISASVMEAFKNRNNSYESQDYEWNEDSLNYEENEIYEYEVDTIIVDSIPVKIINEQDNTEN